MGPGVHTISPYRPVLLHYCMRLGTYKVNTLTLANTNYQATAALEFANASTSAMCHSVEHVGGT